MPDDSGRPKVGPADAATQRKALADYEAGARKENASRKASAPKAAPVTAAVKRSILDELRDALNDKHPRVGEHIIDGKPKSVMDVVDEAVSGAKGANPDY